MMQGIPADSNRPLVSASLACSFADTFSKHPSYHVGFMPNGIPLPSSIHGDRTFVLIPEDVYNSQLKYCKTSLIGHVYQLRKNLNLCKVNAFKAALQSIWKLFNEWSMMALPKGYFDLYFQEC